jgi:hypothetical protein
MGWVARATRWADCGVLGLIQSGELRGDYGIFIDSKEIKKVGDILRLIRVEQDPG